MMIGVLESYLIVRERSGAINEAGLWRASNENWIYPDVRLFLAYSAAHFKSKFLPSSLLMFCGLVEWI